MYIPDTSEPVGDQSEHAHQQHQNSCAVLQVVVQFPGHPAQTQQADHLEGAEQAADALRGDERRDTLGLLQDAETPPRNRKEEKEERVRNFSK